ncbi:MAG: BON domain-containing protein [Dehalococcoidia bacterium]
MAGRAAALGDGAGAGAHARGGAPRPWHEAPPPPDQDQFIKQRVESELGRHGDLPLADLNFDAADALVRVRGTVADEETARRVVERVAAVEGVKAVLSLMHTPDEAPVGGQAGDRSLLYGPPRAVPPMECGNS